MCLLTAGSALSQSDIPVKNNLQEKASPKLRLSVSGGAGFLMASSKNAEQSMVSAGFTTQQAKSYYRDLKSGYGGSADLMYLTNNKYGFGLKYKYFNTSSGCEGFIDPQDGMTMLYGAFNEKIYVNFYAVSAQFRKFAGNDRLSINASYSIGFVTYRNEAEYINNYLLFEGNNAGLDLGLEAEYKIHGNISVFANASAFYSSLSKMKISDGTTSATAKLEKESRENLSRVDISLGIIFYLLNK